MTRKDFELIAATLNKQWRFYWALPVSDTRVDALHTMDGVIEGFVQNLILTNPRFDAERFEAACKAVN